MDVLYMDLLFCYVCTMYVPYSTYSQWCQKSKSSQNIFQIFFVIFETITLRADARFFLTGPWTKKIVDDLFFFVFSTNSAGPYYSHGPMDNHPGADLKLFQGGRIGTFTYIIR